MILVNLSGGLGNQMFQFALYTKLKSMGKKPILVKNHVVHSMRSMNRCTIFDAFKLDKKYSVYKVENNNRIKRVFERCFVKCFNILYTQYREREVGLFDENVLSCENCYLDGYWQTDKYFSDCRSELISAFTLKHPLDEKNNLILSKIKQSSIAISVHVRLGDYTTVEAHQIYGNICTLDYYEKAFDYFENKYENPIFFIFSNEPNKVSESFKSHNFFIINTNDENTGFIDMFLMSQCQHNIIANSSFSWWGAWLNENPNKEVVAPKKWINSRRMIDICPDLWIRF